MIRLGKIFNAPIILTDNLMIYAGVYAAYTAFTSGISAAVMLLLAMVAIGVCVLLHELGHVAAGRRFGVRTANITLNFFGGIAASHPYDWYRLMDRPRQAAIVWFCGPLVNGLIWLALTGIMAVLPSPTLVGYLDWVRTFNIVMAVFNLLPLYPLDGGGLFYCFLRAFTGKLKAIKIASVVSMIGCAGLLLLAVKFHALIAGLIVLMIAYEAYKAPRSALFQ